MQRVGLNGHFSAWERVSNEAPETGAGTVFRDLRHGGVQ